MSQPAADDDNGSGPAAADDRNLIIVTGMSGAGRSTVANALEDLGWFVIDNLPPKLIGTMVEEVLGTAGVPKLAIVVDVRAGGFFEDLTDELLKLRDTGRRPVLVFTEASDDVIVRRQEGARRPHPLQGDGRLLDGIQAERERLRSIRGAADLVMDTSGMTVHQLTARVVETFGDEHHHDLRFTCVSFGFKYGIPVDADLVADMRFLPNPFWVPELRPMTGRDAPVSDYVLSSPMAQRFIDDYLAVLRTVRAGYLKEGKRFVMVAIGCTGGQHRSVAMTEELARRLRELGRRTMVVHRDMGRE